VRYVIHNNHPSNVRFDEEHILVDSDEDNVTREEESEDDLDENYDFNKEKNKI
jgi:hypothetical protein